ncbi:hypothetical protein F5Y12DRAFT_713812 [Xylaria sp. FL1777]|nr:hypothetical protein F5Y12DRAFT_713812 [Xylaria sp. FL1777]
MQNSSRQPRKGSRKSSRQQKRIWVDDDVPQLLAWLDYCIENDVDFNSTVVAHMKRTREKSYTLRQSRDKLMKIWGSKGDYRPGVKSSVVFKEGTKCLEFLDNDTRTRVDRIKLTLNHERPETPRDSPQSTLPLQSDPFGQLDNACSRETSTLSSISTPRSPFSPFEFTTSTDDNIQSCLGEDSDAEDPYKRKHRVPLEEKSPSEASQPLTREALLKYSFPNNNKALEKLQLEAAEKDIKIAQQLEALISRDNRIFQLEIQLSSTLKEFQEMQQCLLVPKDSDPASLIRRLQYSESYLKQQLSTISAFQNDSQNLVASSLGLQPGDICKEMDALEGNILEACASLLNMDQAVVNNGWDISRQDPGLEILLQRSMGSSALKQYRSMSKDSTGQLDLLRALVAASVSISAFESPILDFLTGQSVLLDKYRDCLLMRDGPHGLEAVNRLAHKALISEPYFESEIIQTKSRESATKLAKTIVPLLIAEPDPCEDVTMENGSSDPVEEAEPLLFHNVMDSFQDIFADAMRLRARLLITGKQYQAIFARPGQKFNTTTMNKDAWNYDGYTQRRKSKTKFNASHRSSNTARSDDEDQGEKVNICLFPAIYGYLAKPAHQPGLTSEAKSLVLDYSTFIAPDEHVLEALSATIVSKAVVSVEVTRGI